jgi:hypothetical protein
MLVIDQRYAGLLRIVVKDESGAVIYEEPLGVT